MSQRRRWGSRWCGRVNPIGRRCGRVSRFMLGRGLGGHITEETIDLDSASTPNGHQADRELHPYRAKGAHTTVRTIRVRWRGESYQVSKGLDPVSSVEEDLGQSEPLS